MSETPRWALCHFDMRIIFMVHDDGSTPEAHNGASYSLYSDQIRPYGCCGDHPSISDHGFQFQLTSQKHVYRVSPLRPRQFNVPYLVNQSFHLLSSTGPCCAPVPL